MPYEKGHEYHPPKSGKSAGASPAQRKAKRQMAEVAQDRAPAPHLVEFHILVAAGKCPRLQIDEERTVIGVDIDEQGYEPSLEQKLRSVDWLANRGYGLPAQKHTIDAELRAIGVSAELTVDGQLAPAAIRMMRRLIRGELAPGVDTPGTGDQASGEPDASDAEFVNVKEPSPGDPEGPASDDE